MTIQQANQYFAALPDGFADPAQLGALLPASVQQVQFVGVAGTAGKTAVARLLAAILHAQGIRAGVYHAGCEPLAARIRVDGKPVDEALLCRAADALAAHEELPLQAAELVAAAYCFGEAGCTLAVVELPDAGLAAVLPKMPVCAVTAVGPDGVSRSVERLAALAGGVMRKESICVTAPEQPKAVLSELVVAAGKCGCELVVPDPEGYHLFGGGAVRKPGRLRRLYGAAGLSGASRRRQCRHGGGAGTGALPQGGGHLR